MPFNLEAEAIARDAAETVFGKLYSYADFDLKQAIDAAIPELVSALRSYAASIAADSAREATTQAARDVLAERERQKSVEGWTPEHDDTHTKGQLSQAAGCYAILAGRPDDSTLPARWPWHGKWWKPKGRRRDLVRAGALIIAEIERLDRAALRQIAEAQSHAGDTPYERALREESEPGGMTQ